MFGHSFVSRLVTQMYFPGDPLFAFDPIFNSVPTKRRGCGWSPSFDLQGTQPEWALRYRFDIVLRGKNATPMENKKVENRALRHRKPSGLSSSMG